MSPQFELPVRAPTLQLGFYARLRDAQETMLLSALLRLVGQLDIERLDQELLSFAGKEKLAEMARFGLRGELLFPVPYVLTAKPTILGYYRLLLGFSQKEFYRGPFSRFKAMEDRNILTPAMEPMLSALCRSLIGSAWLLLNGLPEVSQEIIEALTLLTLGPQFRGSRNVTLGAAAIRTVFALIKSIVADAVEEEGPSYFVVKSVAGRIYRIEFSPDPDIAVRQILANGEIRNRIAIEVKGGTDYSNIHNRLGEAEKSHQKAKSEGFTEFWTVINVAPLEQSVWRRETPTTTEVFYLDQIAEIQSTAHERFKEYLISELGIR